VVSRADIDGAIAFIRDHAGPFDDGLLRVADALERVFAGEDANKALGLVAPEGCPQDIRTHMRRARDVWPYLLEGMSLQAAVGELGKKGKADRLSLEAYRHSLHTCRKQLLAETLSRHIDGELTARQRETLERMLVAAASK
jgi:hypothetical protein